MIHLQIRPYRKASAGKIQQLNSMSMWKHRRNLHLVAERQVLYLQCFCGPQTIAKLVKITPEHNSSNYGVWYSQQGGVKDCIMLSGYSLTTSLNTQYLYNKNKYVHIYDICIIITDIQYVHIYNVYIYIIIIYIFSCSSSVNACFASHRPLTVADG